MVSVIAMVSLGLIFQCGSKTSKKAEPPSPENPVIEWTAASYSIKEDAGTDTTTVCANINPAPENELTVSFTTGMTADIDDTDATEGTDYTITTKSLTFPANSDRPAMCLDHGRQ